MAECVVPHCARPTRGQEPFCKECRRLVKEDERYALRMIATAPAYGVSAFEGHDDRSNIMWIWTSAHEGQGYRTRADVSRALHWLEFHLCALSIGKRIARVHHRNAAKVRLRGPRGW